eukprot:11380984-Ditylum_brightwellii.AAC.1
MGHTGSLVIIMRHYALLRDGFSDQWQSSSITESRVAALEADLTGFHGRSPRTPGDGMSEGGHGDATLCTVHI